MHGFFRQYLLVYRPLIQTLNDLLQPYDLSYSLWQVMVYLREHEQAPLVEISTYYGIEKPAITRRVQRLEELGYITISQGADRREKAIALSRAGHGVYAQCRQRITALERRVTESIAAAHLQQAAAVLQQVRDNLH